MSMLGMYRHVAPRLLTVMSTEPSLGEAIALHRPSGSTLEQQVQRQLEAMLSKLPPEARAKAEAKMKSGFLDTFRAQVAEASGALDKLSALRAPVLAKHVVEEREVGDVLSIDKAWHGLHFLLARTAREPTETPGDVVLGGSEVGRDLGMGPVRMMTAERTSAAARALAAQREDELRARYDPNAMVKQEIYGGNWNDGRELEWLMEAFRSVRTYFAKAEDAGHGMLIWLA